MVVILPRQAGLHTSAAAASAPDETLAGRSVVVIGALAGLGRAAARCFAEAGARVLLAGPTEGEVIQALGDLCTVAADEDAVQGVRADVADLEDVRRTFREADRLFGGVDVLLFFVDEGSGSVLGEGPDRIAHALDASVRGYVTCCQEALTRMRRDGSGHIIAIAAKSAPGVDPNSDVYAVSRAGVSAFTESLGAKLEGSGIRVSLIEPDVSPSLDADGVVGPVAECLLRCVVQGTQARRVFVHAAPRRRTI